MNKESLKAIVVGATSGIGKELVNILTKEGWEVGIAGRREEELQKMQSKNLNIVATESIDITHSDAGNKLIKLISKTGGMDLYFHSSGIGYQNRTLDIDKELITIETNALGMVRMVDTAFHYFIRHPEKDGIISVISSIAGTKGLGPAPSYSSSKRFVSHYLESLTHLCHIRKIKHIKFIDIRPGFVNTPLINDGTKYPMQMSALYVANKIHKAIKNGKSIVTINWKYRVLVFLWRLIPRCLWVRIKL